MSTNFGQTDAQSDGLERDGDAIREDMSRTLDEIERKLSPGELLDRSLGYLREHGGGIAESVGETVRESPLPALVTAAGLLWMITSYRSSRRNESSRNTGAGLHYSDYEGTQYGGADAMEDRAGSGASNAAGTLRAKAKSGVEKARSGLESAANRVRDAEGAVEGRIREGATKASNVAKKTMQSTREQTQRATQGFRQMVDEQPLTVGAIGVAVGALLSAALPATEWEKRALGQARERALVKAKEVGNETYDELRETIRGTPEGAAAKQQQDSYAS